MAQLMQHQEALQDVSVSQSAATIVAQATCTPQSRHFPAGNPHQGLPGPSDDSGMITISARATDRLASEGLPFH
jgi:hypothetical protein